MPSPASWNSLKVRYPRTIRSRITSSDQRSPNRSSARLTGHADRGFAFDLFAYPDEQIDYALVCCRREIRGRNGFPPQLTIGDVLDRIGAVSEGAIAEAEARAACIPSGS